VEDILHTASRRGMLVRMVWSVSTITSLRPLRRWAQFSLATMFVVVSVLCVGLATLDSATVHLRPLTGLSTLSLQFTKVSDACLANLTGLGNLKQLHLRESCVTDLGLDELAKL
jgi:hypothetical protein